MECKLFDSHPALFPAHVLLKEASKHHLQARFVLRIVVNDQNISAHIRGIGEWLALPL
jgi:hypothetical protein